MYSPTLNQHFRCLNGRWTAAFNPILIQEWVIYQSFFCSVHFATTARRQAPFQRRRDQQNCDQSPLLPIGYKTFRCGVESDQDLNFISSNPNKLRPLIERWDLSALFNVHAYCLWQYGLSRFQAGYTKLERFLPKNQHTQRKSLNFENWCSGVLSKIGHYF